MNKKAIGITGIIFSLLQLFSASFLLAIIIVIAVNSSQKLTNSHGFKQAINDSLGAATGFAFIISIINFLILFILWILSIIIAFRDYMTGAKVTSLLALIPLLAWLMVFVTFCILVHSARKEKMIYNSNFSNTNPYL
ncbi:hypothetical protein FJO69_00370 [[Mycoplasma] falconis]|uniref:Uncharacterized protein n=1 Tax=[Mycoplasma] falconis TaxID=92403 RepID=A0A501XBW8_9BACT|nr:hypothetical protein [[Mycoplasma] falconis]TPE58051.1 hypothetical protein FJO69_00370 [[Mycoplasma] falconis]